MEKNGDRIKSFNNRVLFKLLHNFIIKMRVFTRKLFNNWVVLKLNDPISTRILYLCNQ